MVIQLNLNYKLEKVKIRLANDIFYNVSKEINLLILKFVCIILLAFNFSIYNQLKINFFYSKHHILTLSFDQVCQEKLIGLQNILYNLLLLFYILTDFLTFFSKRYFK